MFNKLAHFFIKGTMEALKCLIYFIFFLQAENAPYTGKKDFILILLSGIILYLLFMISIEFINKNSKKRWIKIFISMVISFIIVFSILRNLVWQYKMSCIVYLLGIIFLAIVNYKKQAENLRAFIITFSFIALSLVLPIILSLRFIEVIKIYLPLYAIMSILHGVQLNMLTEYDDKLSNVMNEGRNKGMINLILIFISGLSILISTTDFISKAYGYGKVFLQQFIYLIIKPISIVMTWCYKYIFPKTTEWGAGPGNPINQSGLVLMVTIMAIAFVFIFIYSICLKDNKTKVKKTEWNILDAIKNALHFGIDKSEIGNKNNKNKEKVKNLHAIRRIYIDVIKILKTKGIEYNSSYTPNEYNKVIESTEFKLKNINELIDIYNGLRYGNKTVSKEEVSQAYKIKKSL